MPPTYWRDRLALVARSSHLSHTQIQTVHRLYLQIDAYEANNRALDTAPELTPDPIPPMPRAVPQQDLAEASGKRHS
jgi:hypothetical protein